MEIKSLNTNTIIMTIATTMLVIAGCKKNDPKNDPTLPTQLADSAMFVSTLDSVNQSNLGTSIYVLNASTGALTTKYHYAYDSKAKWSAVCAGNGFLYDISSNKINAVDMHTGSILWTDVVANSFAPVLHDDTFYGLYLLNSSLNTGANTTPFVTSTYGVYALDATKQSKTYLWKYEVTENVSFSVTFSANNPPVRYYNGTIYVLPDGLHLTALDAKTGALKWKASTERVATSSLIALDNGVIIAGNTAFDAVTGNKIGTVSPTTVPPVYGAQTTQQAMLNYSTKDSYYVKTSHFNNPPGLSTSFLSAVDRNTGSEKWRINFGSGQVDYDTVNTVEQFWNNKLVIQKFVYTGAGKYGVNVADSHWLIDINTGLAKLKIDDANKGLTVANYILGNSMYLSKRFESTLHGLPYGSDSPPVNYLFAIDLSTGKQKWNNDKLFANYTGAVSSCVFVGGKGYSSNIQ